MDGGGTRSWRERCVTWAAWRLPPIVAVAVAAGVVIALGLLFQFPDEYQRWQSARAKELRHGSTEWGELRNGTELDSFFISAYTAVSFALVYALRRLRRLPRGRPDPATRTALALFTLGAVADVVETASFRISLERLIVSSSADVDLTTQLSRWMTGAKWGLLGAGAAVLLWNLWRPAEVKIEPTPPSKPDWQTQEWNRPAKGEERLGICASGGGIRSAAFSLGALQSLDQRNVLRRARYLAAISGGGYLAAGMAVSNALRPGPNDRTPPPSRNRSRPFAPASPEERWFRNHSSYLVPSFTQGVGGVIQLLAGLVVNVVLIWLLLFAIARPVGWAIAELHPELKFKRPVLLMTDATAEVRLAGVTEVTGPSDGATAGRAPGATQWFRVDVDPFTEGTCEPAGSASAEVPPYAPPGDGPGNTYEFVVLPAVPGLVSATGGTATIVRQPTVQPAMLVENSCTPMPVPEACDDDPPPLCAMRVERELELELDGKPVFDAAGATRSISIGSPAELRPDVGLRGRDDLIFDGWMWGVSGAAIGVGLMAGFAVVLLRAMHIRQPLKWLMYGGLLSGSAAFALFIGLPWLVQELPGVIESAVGILPGVNVGGTTFGSWYDYLVPTGGFLILAIGAVRKYLRNNQSNSATPTPRTGGIFGRIWGALTSKKELLGWYELSPAKIVAGVVIVVVPVIMFVSQLQYAVANGPSGELMGFPIARDNLPDWMFQPDWLRWATVALALVLMSWWVDSHAWSLEPYYKRRLSEAYLLRRKGDMAEPINFDRGPISYGNVPAEDLPQAELPGPPHEPAPPPGGTTPVGVFPQLITCCAVNLSTPGDVPPSRRAASFTFSSTEIGGPVVGYRKPEDYWQALSFPRQRDITVPAAMAISGAAFSPAMGKFNLGPVGAIYAVLNLRLGVWIPHPQQIDPDRKWRDRPSWSWWLREVINRYRKGSRYLYVSDGGHWENMGLVELLRRGCTNVICINAGGDGQQSFASIGEAIALAREELGVEVTINPEPLRPPLKADEESRPLRRRSAATTDESRAEASFVYGMIRWRNPATGDLDDRVGHLWLIEPTLPSAMPADVQAFAESSTVFPDDSTADQIFNHRQFEAFRALGYYQAEQLPVAEPP